MFLERQCKYQSIVGSIGWLVQSTHPDLAPLHPFLLAYNNKPSRSHMNPALCVLHYIHSTINYSFTFMSEAKIPLHTYMSFPHRLDTEAYNDAISPKPGDHHRLMTYSDACWGSQIGNAIREGIQLPLCKLCSMSGAILFRSGGPITWKADHQDCTALSSCDTEISTTHMSSCLTINTRNMILHLADCGFPITNASIATPVFEDNNTCIKWCHNLTSKGNCHIRLKENITREWIADGAITVSHVNGKCNPADIFTKEMQDGANFLCLCDSFMRCGSNFLKGIHATAALSPEVDHIAQSTQYVPPSAPGFLNVLLSHVLFRMP